MYSERQHKEKVKGGLMLLSAIGALIGFVAFALLYK